MKRQPDITVDDAQFEYDVDDQIRRLRRMLVLMAPETGFSALGATCGGVPTAPPGDRSPALKDRRH